MKGVFAKTHLATLLLLYKQGRLPDLQRMVAREPGDAKFQELHEALSQGIFMHIFPFAAVRDHPDDFKCLMASDNFDHAYGMTGSEIGCISVMRELIRNMEVPKAVSQFTAVTSEINKLSTQRWGPHVFVAFRAFAQTTPELQMEMLGGTSGARWQRCRLPDSGRERRWRCRNSSPIGRRSACWLGDATSHAPWTRARSSGFQPRIARRSRRL